VCLSADGMEVCFMLRTGQVPGSTRLQPWLVHGSLNAVGLAGRGTDGMERMALRMPHQN
jgi:hypothetical protein